MPQCWSLGLARLQRPGYRSAVAGPALSVNVWPVHERLPMIDSPAVSNDDNAGRNLNAVKAGEYLPNLRDVYSKKAERRRVAAMEAPQLAAARAAACHSGIT